MFKQFEKIWGIKSSFTFWGKKNAYDSFLEKFGGMQFAQGLFNVFNISDLDKWSQIVFGVYPQYYNNVKLFGYDWLGRVFGMSTIKRAVYIFEIGTLDALEVPCSFLEFLNDEIPYHHDACFASAFFEEWKKLYQTPKYGRCIGYKVPLFLGGSDVIENMEDSNMEVYWYLLSEISKKNKG